MVTARRQPGALVISGTTGDENVFLLIALFVASFALGVGLALLALL